MRTVLLAAVLLAVTAGTALTGAAGPIALTDAQLDRVAAGGVRVGTSPTTRESTIMALSSDPGQARAGGPGGRIEALGKKTTGDGFGF